MMLGDTNVNLDDKEKQLIFSASLRHIHGLPKQLSMSLQKRLWESSAFCNN